MSREEVEEIKRKYERADDVASMQNIALAITGVGSMMTGVAVGHALGVWLSRATSAIVLGGITLVFGVVAVRLRVVLMGSAARAALERDPALWSAVVVSKRLTA
jgi:hypothetical protein